MNAARMARLRAEFPGWRIVCRYDGGLLVRPPKGADWSRFGRRFAQLATLPEWHPPAFRVISRPRKCWECRYFVKTPGLSWRGRCILLALDTTQGRRSCGRAASSES